VDIGVSTAIFYPDETTEDAIRLVASKGFRTGEIFANSFSEFTEDYGHMLADIAKNNDFKVSSIHTVSSAFEPYLFDRYERRRDDFFRIFKDFVRFGNILGAKVYTFHGLVSNHGNKIQMKDIIYVYEKMIDAAGEQGISIGQENVSWCLSGDIEYLKRLKDGVRGPLKFTLDIKQAVKAGRSPYDYLEIYGTDLVNLHLNDNDRDHTCLLPGKGTFDYNELKERLGRAGYRGPGIIEVYRDNYDTVEDLARSRRLLAGLL
jgi:sugar phosphate isomerase/epimerase